MYIVLETHGGAAYTSVCLNEDGSTVCFHQYENAMSYAEAQCQEGIIVEVY